MTLVDAKEGDRLRVVNCMSEEVCMQALRFGINEGSQICLKKKIPGGPVIVTKNQLEIAIGRQLAASIEVEAVI